MKTILLVVVATVAMVVTQASAQMLNRATPTYLYQFPQTALSGDNCVLSLQIRNLSSTPFSGTVGAWGWCTSAPLPMAVQTNGIPANGMVTLTIPLTAVFGTPNTNWSMGMSVWACNPPYASLDRYFNLDAAVNLQITNVVLTDNGK